MERSEYKEIKNLYGLNFIGPLELSLISENLGIINPNAYNNLIPKIHYSQEELIIKSKSHILFLFVPFFIDKGILTICKLREHLGINPFQYEPCFYNQDWYLNEKFANEGLNKFSWNLIKKEVYDESRGLIPDEIEIKPMNSALILTYLFFATYFHSNKILWEHDFIWTSDKDSNFDKVYVGRYLDKLGIANKGFSIHRHLSITKHYGQL